MEQKRILWIVAAVGIFLLVVVGAALILYAPQKQNSIQITETNNGSNSTGHDLLDFNGNLSNGSSIPSTVKELTVIAENATIISDKANTESLKGTTIKINNSSEYSENMPDAFAPMAEPFGNAENKGLASTNGMIDGKTDVKTTGSQSLGQIAPTVDTNNTMANRFPQVTEAYPPAPQQVQIEIKPIKIETVDNKTVTSVTRVETPVAKPVVKTEKPVSQSKTVAKTTTKAEPNTSSSKTSAKTTTASKTAKKSTEAAKVTTPPAKYWVQAASFTNKKNAEAAKEILENEKIQSEIFTFSKGDGKLYYRVRVGPYSTASEAEYWRSRISEVEQFSKNSTYVTNSSLPLAKN